MSHYEHLIFKPVKGFAKTPSYVVADYDRDVGKAHKALKERLLPALSALVKWILSKIRLPWLEKTGWFETNDALKRSKRIYPNERNDFVLLQCKLYLAIEKVIEIQTIAWEKYGALKVKEDTYGSGEGSFDEIVERLSLERFYAIAAHLSLSLGQRVKSRREEMESEKRVFDRDTEPYFALAPKDGDDDDDENDDDENDDDENDEVEVGYKQSYFDPFSFITNSLDGDSPDFVYEEEKRAHSKIYEEMRPYSGATSHDYNAIYSSTSYGSVSGELRNRAMGTENRANDLLFEKFKERLSGLATKRAADFEVELLNAFDARTEARKTITNARERDGDTEESDTETEEGNLRIPSLLRFSSSESVGARVDQIAAPVLEGESGDARYDDGSVEIYETDDDSDIEADSVSKDATLEINENGDLSIFFEDDDFTVPAANAPNDVSGDEDRVKEATDNEEGDGDSWNMW
jgi:hypothetical protein